MVHIYGSPMMILWWFRRDIPDITKQAIVSPVAFPTAPTDPWDPWHQGAHPPAAPPLRRLETSRCLLANIYIYDIYYIYIYDTYDILYI